MIQRISLLTPLLVLLLALPAWAAPPNVAISSPQAEATVTTDHAQVTVLFDAGEGALVDQVELLVDGRVHAVAEVAPPVQTGSVTLSWQVSRFINGLHRLVARGRNTKGEKGESGVTVLVDRGARGSGAPVVVIERPKPGEVVSGTTEVKIRAFDPDGIKYVMLLIDDAFACLTNIPPFSYMWNTTRNYANGRHTLRAKAFDSGENEGVSELLEVLVDNPGGRTELQTPESPPQGEPVLNLPSDVSSGASAAVVETAALPAAGAAPAAPAPGEQPTEPLATAAVPAAGTVSEAEIRERAQALPTASAASVPTTRPAAATVAAEPPATVKPLQVALAPELLPTSTAKVRSAVPAATVAAPRAATSKSVASAPRPVPAVSKPVAPLAAPAGPTAALPARPAAPATATAAVPARADAAAVGPSISPASAQPRVTPRAAAPVPAVHPAPATDRLPAPQVVAAVSPPMVSQAVARTALSAPTTPAQRTPREKAVQVAMALPAAPAPTLPAATSASKPALPVPPAQRSTVAPASQARTAAGSGPVQVAMAPAQVRITIPATPAATRGEPGLYLNDKLISADQVPLISPEGLGLAPFRRVIEASGGVVSWLQAERVVKAHADDLDLRLTIGSREALAGSRTILMDLPAVIVAGRTIVPVRFFREALGYEVRYDALTGAIYIAAR